MNNKHKVLGGGVHQLNKRCNSLPLDLQLFALVYNKVDNPYNHTMLKNTYTKGDVKIIYNLREYYEKIANYSTITSLPEENANYIKEALPNVVDCSYMLYQCRKLTSIDTTGWDTSNVIDMSDMFMSCNALTTLDVSNFNTSNVTDMNAMFGHCYQLTATALDVSNWDTSKVTDMGAMFIFCSKLTTLYASNWDTSNVTNMLNMFQFCNNLTILDVSNWDTSKVTDMDGMFSYCYSLTTIIGVIDMKSCTSYGGMFNNCSKLTGVKIKNPPSGVTATSGIGGLAAGKYEIVS